MRPFARDMGLRPGVDFRPRKRGRSAVVAADQLGSATWQTTVAMRSVCSPGLLAPLRRGEASGKATSAGCAR